MKISQLFYYSRYAILLTLLLGFMGFKVTGFSFFTLMIIFVTLMLHFDFGYLALNYNQSRATFNKMIIIYSVGFSSLNVLLMLIINLVTHHVFKLAPNNAVNDWLSFLIVWIWMAYVIVLAFTIRIAKMKSSYRLGIPSTITFLGVVTIGYLSVFLPEFQQSSLNLIVIALAIFYCIQVVSLRRAVRKLDFDKTNYRKNKST